MSSKGTQNLLIIESLKDKIFSHLHLLICAFLDTVPRSAEAEEPGAPDLVRTSASLGRRQHEEPGECDLHVPGPHDKWVQ